MRLLPILVSLFIVIGVSCLSAQSTEGTIPEPNRNYKLLREDENWSFLLNPALRQDFWDFVKYIPFARRDDWYLSVGGEAREVWEQIGNDNWGLSPIMNGYFNQRYMLHFDVHYARHVR